MSVLPWSEMDSLQLETGSIKDQLVALNRRGYLTINSQPGVNGASSTDPKVGWGGPNGWVSVPLLRKMWCIIVLQMFRTGRHELRPITRRPVKAVTSQRDSFLAAKVCFLDAIAMKSCNHMFLRMQVCVPEGIRGVLHIP